MTLGTTTVNFGPAGDVNNTNLLTYYNTTVLPTLSVGTPTPISINFYDAPDAEPMYFAVLIDLNQDFFFDVTTELLIDNGNTIGGPLPCISGSPLTVNSSINIPLGSLNGPTRMRLVRFSDFYGFTPNIYDPTWTYEDCYSFAFNLTYGCTYDFNVNIAAPNITANPASLAAFSTVVGTPSAFQSFTVSASNLLGNLTITAPAQFEVSTNSASGYTGALNITPTAGSVPNTTIYVRYNPSAAGTHNGNIIISSLGAVDDYVTVTGTSTAPIIPTLTAVPTSLSPFTAFIGYPSAPQSFAISGVYLTGNVNISAPAEFQISLTAGSGYGSSVVLTPTAGTLASTTIYVRYNPGSVGTHTGVVSCFSTGSNVINIPVNGTASLPPPASIVVNPTTLNTFNTIVGIPSAAQTVTVSGSYLLGDINLIVPAPFEISLSAGSGYSTALTLVPVGGMVNATTIYVRFNPQIPNTYNGDLTISSPNVTSIVIPLVGIGAPNTPVVTLAPTTLNYFITTFGIPSAVQSIAVSGMYLIGPLVISAPTHFQVSTMPTSGFGSYIQLQPTLTGAVPLTTIYVRYNPLAPGNHQGDLTVSSIGALTKTMTLKGYAYPVSVTDMANENLYIYPTPCKDMVYLSDRFKQADVQVFDLSGRKVLDIQQVQSSFPIPHLMKGIYLVHIQFEGKTYTTKLVKE